MYVFSPEETGIRLYIILIWTWRHWQTRSSIKAENNCTGIILEKHFSYLLPRNFVISFTLLEICSFHVTLGQIYCRRQTRKCPVSLPAICSPSTPAPPASSLLMLVLLEMKGRRMERTSPSAGSHSKCLQQHSGSGGQRSNQEPRISSKSPL